MKFSRLTAISPLDGRYGKKLDPLRHLLSEYGLIYYRVWVEIRWLETLMTVPEIRKTHPLSPSSKRFLQAILVNFSEKDAHQVKRIEKTTRHDVKAVEYYLKKKCSTHPSLKKVLEMIHLGCTSDDINNLSYALILSKLRKDFLLPALHDLKKNIHRYARQFAACPMLGRTHGQPATPTTLGKEFANYYYRIQRHLADIADMYIPGKFNGAVGNYNSLVIAFPNIPWDAVSNRFISRLGLEPNPYTTQIEPHDGVAKLCHSVMRLNTTLIDFSRNIWLYISLGYFSQAHSPKQVGSSSMPHKINPIEFENAEGNLGLSNALLEHFANKLPISRWQRDLSDSTVQRNLGVAFSHSLLAYQQILSGLKSIHANREKMRDDLNQHWEVLSEAIQNVMRKYQLPEPYEQLKLLSRGHPVTRETLQLFIEKLKVPEPEKARLKALTPETYLGLAIKLAKKIK